MNLGGILADFFKPTGRIGSLSPILRLAAKSQFTWKRLPISQPPDDFKDICPSREGLSIHPLEGIYGLDEEKLLRCHLAFFSRSEEIASAAAWPPATFQVGIRRMLIGVTAVQATATVYDIQGLRAL